MKVTIEEPYTDYAGDARQFVTIGLSNNPSRSYIVIEKVANAAFVNWSTSGNQTLKFAREFAEGMNTALELAERLESGFLPVSEQLTPTSEES